MARSFYFLLCFLVIFHGCLGRKQPSRQQQECDISRLNAQRPSRTIRSEAGVIEVFDHNSQDLRCAGVAFARYTIEPNGLLLPSYVNAPQLLYFVQGRGLQGILMSGCAETFQSFEESRQGQQQQEQGQQGQQGEREQGQEGQQGEQEQGQGRQRQQGQQFRGDQHQKIREVGEGDVMVVPVGTGHFLFNNGGRRLVVVSLLDTSNDEDQLDTLPRRFYLAGNPQDEFQLQGQQGQQGQQEQQEQQGREQQHGRGREGQQQQEQEQEQQGGGGKNIFSGFDAERLAEAFNVEVEIIRKLQGQNDRRGNIIRVEGGLEGVVPPRRQREQQDPLYESGNGYEETICTMKLRQNIGDPQRADLYIPRAGHRSSVTGYDLPVLQNTVRLSAHQAHLHPNAVMLPYYNMNAHSIIYAIRGSARIQVVQQNGQNVFNEEIQQGQVLVVPQNYASMINARDSGFEYVAFKTHPNAMINTLAGNLSILRAMPLQVLSTAFQVSENQARQLKQNRQESILAPRGSSRSQYRAYA